MLDKLLEKCGYLEVLARRILFHHPELKTKIKRKFKQGPKNIGEFNRQHWDEYKKAVHQRIEDEDIVLIHSALGGLAPMGVSINDAMSLINELLDRKCTVVVPAFPITNLKIVDNALKLYDPMKTPCWTGMIPNAFLKLEGVIRSTIPYNSLAAAGPHAKRMMEHDKSEQFVYGPNSPWNYLITHEAKILFIGTTPNESNTIQTHMIADYMKDEWPIKNWYDEIIAPVKIDGNIIERTLYIQDIFWTQFVADRYINALLKKEKIVEELMIEECPLGVVSNSRVMVDRLVELTEKDKMPYIIPKKYYK